MKKISMIIFALVGAWWLLNFGPVWAQRIFGYNFKVTRVYSPQWLNDKECVYLEVENYYNSTFSFTTGYPSNLNPLLCFRQPNSTFYLYKVNVDNLSAPKLLKKVTLKLDYDFSGYDDGGYGKFVLRKLDDGRISLLLRSSYDYHLFFLDSEGKILQKHYIKPCTDSGIEYSVIDVSPDGEKYLYSDGGYYIKNIDGGEERKVFDEKESWHSKLKWISKGKLVAYKYSSLPAKEDQDKTKLIIFIKDEIHRNENPIYSVDFDEYKEMYYYTFGASISKDNKTLILNSIGIFEKTGENWQMTKDLRPSKTNKIFKYPCMSPNKKNIVYVNYYKGLSLIRMADYLML